MLDALQQKTLKDTANRSIKHGFTSNHALNVDITEFDECLRHQRATFVTLRHNNQLRGCIGVLEAYRPLVQDIASNAWSAAFQDSRFPPLQQQEFDELDIHISILQPAQNMQFSSEKNLIDQINKGEDGIILRAAGKRATFLPSVWDAIDSKQEFLNQLKLKAGLPKNYWSDDITVQRYAVESF